MAAQAFLFIFQTHKYHRVCCIKKHNDRDLPFQADIGKELPSSRSSKHLETALSNRKVLQKLNKLSQYKEEKKYERKERRRRKMEKSI